MNAFNFKCEYAASKRTTSVFKVAFFLVAVSFVIETVALFISSGESYTFSGGGLSSLLFWTVFCFVFLLLCANFALWLGMIQFLLKYDGRSVGRKTLWFFIIFWGLSFGAALYYLFVYRKFLDQIPQSNLDDLHGRLA
jgi:hypothetical protein